jgi:integrase
MAAPRAKATHDKHIPDFVTWKGNNKAAATAKFHEKNLGVFSGWLRECGQSLSVHDLDYSLVGRYQSWLQNTPHCAGFHKIPKERSLETVRGHLRTLKAYSTYLHKVAKVTKINQLQGYELPSGETPEKEPLTPVEIQKLLNLFNRKTATGTRDYALVLLFLESGMRSGEVLRLRWDDLNWGAAATERYILVRPENAKRSKNRKLPFPETAHDALEDWREHRFNADLPYVFSNNRGEPLVPNALKMAMRRWGTKAGIPRLHAHLLRHTHATQSAILGVRGEDIQIQLGHSTMAMTLKYVARAQREEARLRNSQLLVARLGVKVM